MNYFGNLFGASQGSGGGGTAEADWTDAERQQLRYRLGIDGTAVAPSTGAPHLSGVTLASGPEAQLTALENGVEAILARLAVGPIEVTSPVSASGELTINQGDSRRIRFENPGNWPDLTGAEIDLIIRRVSDGATILNLPGGVEGDAAEATAVYFDPLVTDTARLVAVGPKFYEYKVGATWAHATPVRSETLVQVASVRVLW